MRRHVSYSTGLYLPVGVGVSFGATTYSVALDLTYQLRWTLVLSHVLRLQTSLPCWDGLRCYRMSYNSGPRLPAGEGSDAATRYAVPCAPHTSSIKKNLADLPVQLGTCVSKAHMHIFKAPDARAIMGLQDVRIGGALNVCKMCGHTATMQCRPY
jgi:hypothetical protein